MSLDAELAKLTEIVGAVALPYKGKSVEVEGDGTLILKGTLATCGVDRQMEAFDEASLRTAFQKYFERHPMVVFNHRLNQSIGKLIAANFTRSGEIEVEAEIPKPPEDDRELTGIYQRIKSGVLRAFSIGGRWKRYRCRMGSPNCSLPKWLSPPLPPDSASTPTPYLKWSA